MHNTYIRLALPTEHSIEGQNSALCFGVLHLEGSDMGNASSSAVSQRLEHASKTGVLSLKELKLTEVRGSLAGENVWRMQCSP
jgi:hypothetical protein